MTEFTAAGIQIAVEPGKVKANTEKAIAWVERAVKEVGAELAVLPETVTTGFTPNVPVDQHARKPGQGRRDPIGDKWDDHLPTRRR